MQHLGLSRTSLSPGASAHPPTVSVQSYRLGLFVTSSSPEAKSHRSPKALSNQNRCLGLSGTVLPPGTNAHPLHSWPHKLNFQRRRLDPPQTSSSPRSQQGLQNVSHACRCLPSARAAGCVEIL